MTTAINNTLILARALRRDDFPAEHLPEAREVVGGILARMGIDVPQDMSKQFMADVLEECAAKAAEHLTLRSN